MKSSLIWIAWFCASSSLFMVEASYVTDNLPGEWRENGSERENLSDFLTAIGLGAIQKLAATLIPFDNEQTISFDESTQVFEVKTKNGPLKKESNFMLKIDNVTVTEVDLKILGGKTDATGAVVGNSLMTYLRKPGGSDIFLTAKRTISSDDKEKMTYTTHHLPSGQKLVAHFYRQKT